MAAYALAVNGGLGSESCALAVMSFGRGRVGVTVVARWRLMGKIDG